MSTSSSAVTGGPTTAGSTPPLAQNFATLGLGYAIAIALGFLVLLSTVLLASYVCCRASRNHHHHHHHHHQNPNPNTSSDGIILPRIIFVAEDDDEADENTIIGLDQAVINSYPKFPFSKSRDHNESSSTSCSICLCEYRDGEMLRMMPDCRHYFHLCCIDAWLRLNASCPVCRNSPLPTPLSTPLSEVVPLSQYSGGRRR
ncbi:hypothetical protein L1049_014157 [Liquidambar formosana]|uniref:RING-type domain-containing protein n=1 Tax=Liquidambar formosana TaxID=63359 RepID=A0AAP0WZC3_LIQFO